jgi:hypothetical protein
MNRTHKLAFAQGLKPASISDLSGTAEAVPFHKTIYEKA